MFLKVYGAKVDKNERIQKKSNARIWVLDQISAYLACFPLKNTIKSYNFPLTLCMDAHFFVKAFITSFL